MMDELTRIREHYARRLRARFSSDPLLPWIYMTRQEKERALVLLIKYAGLAPVSNKWVLEVGRGGGVSLHELLWLGFSPEHLVGSELIPKLAEDARRYLPPAVRIIEGDALNLDLGGQLFDIVLQSTVFSSILDDEFQRQLANRMWNLAKPGGGIIWYDFVYDNPRNPDVKGVSLQRIKKLFPRGNFRVWRVTLAPPISRGVTRIHPSLYGLFNALPLLRTHLLCWIERPITLTETASGGPQIQEQKR